MKKHLLIFVLFLFAFCASFTNAQWKQTGPNGGWVNDLSVSGGKIYAASYGGVLFSEDGMGWQHSNWGMMEGDVRSVAATNTKVFAGTWGEGIYMRDIYGLIWEKCVLPNNTAGIQCLAVIGNNVFAGTYSDGVYLTTDNGNTWTAVNNGLTSDQIECFAVSGTDIYCGAEGGGIFLSTNNGTNWTAVNAGLPNDSPISLAVNGNNVYVGLWANGIYYSPNKGQGWIPYAKPVSYPYSITFHGTDIYVCGSSSGVWRSSDDGANWKKLNDGTNGMPSSSQITDLSFIGETLVASESTVNEGSKGMYVSTNYGANWTHINWGQPKYYVNGIAVENGNISLATASGMYRSTDNGTNWTRRTIHNKTGWADFTAIAFRSANSGFAGDINGYVYYSTDEGGSWWEPGMPYQDQVQIENGAIISSFAFIGTSVFAATKAFRAGVEGGVYKSTDNGSTWARVSSGLPALADTNTLVNSLVVIGTNLFAGTGHGVYMSANNGASWTPVNNGLIYHYVTSLAAQGTELFAGTSNGVFRSNDNGANWSLSLSDKYVSALTVVDTNVFAGTLSQGIYWLHKSDSTWRYRDLPDVEITSFAINNGYLFSATSQNSLWKNPIGTLTPVEEIKNNLPAEFCISQNYPNPFNPTTTLSFAIGHQSFVSLKVYDILGREVSTLVNEEKPAGEYNVKFDAAGLTSGIYFYRIQAGKYSETRKMILMK